MKAPRGQHLGVGQVLLTQPSGKTRLANTLILDFRAPELRENKFLLFKYTQSLVFCYESPSKLI